MKKVSQKVSMLARIGVKTPEEIVNDTLWGEFKNLMDMPDEVDYSAIDDMLEHDKPEGDTVLYDLSRLGEEGFD